MGEKVERDGEADVINSKKPGRQLACKNRNN